MSNPAEREKDAPARPKAPRHRRNQGVLLPGDILLYARRMRSEPPDAERRLWYLLQNRRLGGFKFRRQHPVGRYILDFYCPDARLGVELDGGQHSEEEQRAYDARREQFLRSRDIRLLRFWDCDALKNTLGVLETIWDALHAQSLGSGGAEDKTPSPSPLPEGEGKSVRFADAQGRRLNAAPPSVPSPLGRG